MDVERAYNEWADQYDTNENKTRDLEAVSLRETLSGIRFDSCLEIGCGTGKNTQWLLREAQELTAVDFSDEMLHRARAKTNSEKVRFVKADITRDWFFADRPYDLATFSLVLEHVQDLDEVFTRLRKVVKPGGHVYIGELHPFKQYSGSKARFESEKGVQILRCYTHNISDFIKPALSKGFSLWGINEYFDDDNKSHIPRIISLLFQKDMQ